MSALAGLLLLLIPQDNVGDLVRQLGDESIEVRERAAAALVKIGEPARAALVKAKESGSEEVRARVAAILKSLDVNREMRDWLAPPPKVVLSGEMTLEEAAREFERQTGQKVHCAEWPASKFDVRVKDGDAWSALEAICRASGARTFLLTTEGPQLAGDRFREVPMASSGAFCIRFDGFAFRRTYHIDHVSESKTLSLSLVVGWGRAVAPTKMALALDRVEDDLGNDLAPGFLRMEARTFSGTPLSVTEPKPEFCRPFHLTTEELPDPKALKIAKLAGSVHVWIRASTDDVSFPVVEGKSRTEPVKLCDSQLRETSELSVTLAGSARQGATLHCVLKFENCDPRLLKDTFRLWHLTDKKGRRYVGTIRTRQTGDPRSRTFGIEFQNLPADAEPDTVKVSLPKRIVGMEIPFVLKDIPLK